VKGSLGVGWLVPSRASSSSSSFLFFILDVVKELYFSGCLVGVFAVIRFLVMGGGEDESVGCVFLRD